MKELSEFDYYLCSNFKNHEDGTIIIWNNPESGNICPECKSPDFVSIYNLCWSIGVKKRKRIKITK